MEKRAYDGDKKRKKDLKTEWTMTAKKKKKKRTREKFRVMREACVDDLK